MTDSTPESSLVEPGVGVRTPQVLFAVPTLGTRMDLLRESLASISAQDGVTVDLVIVAPPTDAIRELATKFGARLVADPDRGLSGALNAALSAASPSTDYFAWLGDDDLLTPGSLARAISRLDSRPEATMAYGWCDYMNEEGTVVFSSRAGRWAAQLVSWGPNLIPQPGSVQRLAAVRAVGGLDESLRYGMDLDLFLKLRSHGPLIHLDETLARFRWHADSNTVGNQAASSQESEDIRLRYLSARARAARPVIRRISMFSLALARAHVTRRATRHRGGSSAPAAARRHDTVPM